MTLPGIPTDWMTRTVHIRCVAVPSERVSQFQESAERSTDWPRVLWIL